jgi:RecA-family ATPase
MEITLENPGLPVCRLAELEEPAAETRWLVASLWGRAAVGFVAGHPKVGKTWLGLDLALSVATGTPCLERFEVQDPGPVLVYLAEDHPHTVRERLAGLCQLRGLRIEEVALHVITAPAVRLDIERDRVRLTETVAAIRPRLLLLDPLVRLHRRDE